MHGPRPRRSLYDGPVVVVGAGVAGLVSAQLLLEAGAEVVVIEREPVVGGLARSFRYDGFVFDVGPHRFHTGNPNVATYLSRMLRGDGTMFPRRSEVYFRGRYYRWPLRPSNLVQLPPELGLRAGFDLAANQFRTYQVDSFETYILRQYGPTLYEHFFRGYSEKFLGIHPRDTHPDWAKTGINRAVIDEKLEMHSLSQLLRTTLLSSRQAETSFLYPTRGMEQAWWIVGERIRAMGGTILTGHGAEMRGEGDRVVRVRAGEVELEPSVVIWTAPITLACRQLGLPVPRLEYLGLLLFNLCVRAEVPRQYQWCYYGAEDIVFNRVSIPRFFSAATAPPGCTGLCVEVTCRAGDARWRHAERLVDWVLDDLVKVGMLPGRRAVESIHVERVRESYPIYRLDYPGELESARRRLARFTNLHLAGRTGMFWYNNMDHSIENAMQLCRRLLREAGHSEVQEEDLACGHALRRAG